ncbi:MAG TPA: replicative DNA helicase [Firmicutes bacterium]|nr:replicative DNA helicase [Bacillota bacterium]
MPHSVEAEQAVLGSMLIDERCVPDVVARLSPDDFFLRQNRELYEVLYGMFNRFETIDPVTVLDRMKQAGLYDENTSVPYLRQLMEITPTAANVLEYADIVSDKALLRRIGEAAGQLSELVRQEGGTARQILEAAEQRIYAIRQGKSARDMAHIATVMGQVWDTIQARQASGEEFPGLATGLVDLDRRIAGLNNSDLIILAARPGMGKTSLALNIALEAGKRSGKSVAVFSLEMNREQLGMRLISMESLIDSKKLLTGRLSGEEEWTRAAMAVAALSQANIYLDDDAGLSVADMNAKCRRVKNLGLVVVDYLQLMTSAGGPQRAGDNRQQIVSDMSRSLKLMAKELNVPVLCLSQLSRANESRAAGQRRPMLSDLRESGSIEQDADVVLFIYRESYYENDTDNPNVAECIVAKNRHGETGTVLLEWRPEFTTFRNLAWRDEEDDYG